MRPPSYGIGEHTACGLRRVAVQLTHDFGNRGKILAKNFRYPKVPISVTISVLGKVAVFGTVRRVFGPCRSGTGTGMNFPNSDTGK